MKKIEAIIRPEKLDSVRHALEDISSPGLMITEIEGHGKQKGITRQWRGKEYKVELLPKIKIEIVYRYILFTPINTNKRKSKFGFILLSVGQKVFLFHGCWR